MKKLIMKLELRRMQRLVKLHDSPDSPPITDKEMDRIIDNDPVLNFLHEQYKKESK